MPVGGVIDLAVFERGISMRSDVPLIAVDTAPKRADASGLRGYFGDVNGTAADPWREVFGVPVFAALSSGARPDEQGVIRGLRR